jgi:hypothetical protein
METEMNTIETMSRITCLFIITLGLLTTAAAAQPQNSPRLTASVAAGLAIPLHADFGFNAPEWQIAIRTAVSDHFLLEGFFDEWRQSTERVQLGVPLHSPTGVIGHVGRLSSRTEYMTRSIGMNALARRTLGRVTLSGGGGAGFLVYRRDYAQTLSACESAIPQVCQDYQNTWSNGSFTVQAVVAVDAAITSRLAAFAQYQVTAPVNDFGATQLGVVGGVRMRVW